MLGAQEREYMGRGAFDVEGGSTYVNDRIFAFHGDFQLGLGEFDNQVASLQIAWHGYGDVEILDGLGPFVREFGLLFSLTGACLLVFLLALLWRRGGRHVWCGQEFDLK